IAASAAVPPFFRTSRPALTDIGPVVPTTTPCFPSASAGGFFAFSSAGLLSVTPQQTPRTRTLPVTSRKGVLLLGWIRDRAGIRAVGPCNVYGRAGGGTRLAVSR